MRKRTKLVLIAMSVSLGFSGMALYKKIAFSKAESQNKWVPQELGKHMAPIKTQILPLEQTPESSDREVTLVGQITLISPINGNLHYEWSVPAGVTVVGGDLSGSSTNAQAGQVLEVKLTVVGFSKEYQSQVSLKASAQKGLMEMASSALISSRPEDNWESIAPEMQKAAEAALGVEKFRKPASY